MSVPNCRHALRALADVSECTRAEPGCLGIDVFESLREPLIFAIHSEWVDEIAFERHAKLPHTQRFLGTAANLLTNPVQGLRLRKLVGDSGANPR